MKSRTPSVSTSGSSASSTNDSKLLSQQIQEMSPEALESILKDLERANEELQETLNTFTLIHTQLEIQEGLRKQIDEMLGAEFDADFRHALKRLLEYRG